MQLECGDGDGYDGNPERFFGWIVAILFWGWNLLMAWGLFSGLAKTADHYSTIGSGEERTGAAIGTALGAGAMLFLWVAGSVILGLMMLFTRGKRVLVTREAQAMTGLLNCDNVRGHFVG